MHTDQTDPKGATLLKVLVQKMTSAYYVCCILLNALKTSFIREANSMHPDQTAAKGAV